MTSIIHKPTFDYNSTLWLRIVLVKRVMAPLLDSTKILCLELDKIGKALDKAAGATNGLSIALSNLKWRYRVYFWFDSFVRGIFGLTFGSEENWKWMLKR